MKYLSIFEKLLCLFNLLKDSWLNLAFMVILLLLLILVLCKKISKKMFLIFTLISYLGLLGAIIYSYHEPLGQTADSISNHFFTNVYFPSIYVYLFVLIFMNVISATSFLQKKSGKSYCGIHGVFCFLLNFVFTFILKIIAVDKVDVFSKTSMFANTDLVVLLEFSIQLFIIWLLALIIVFATDVIFERVINRRKERFTPVSMEMTISSEELQNEYAKEENKKENEAVSSVVGMNIEQQFIPNMASYEIETSNEIDTKEVELPASMVSYVPNINLNVSNENKVDWNLDNNKNEFLSTEETFSQNNSFDLSSFIPRQQNVFIPNFNIPEPTSSMETMNTNSNQIFEQILKNELPVIHEEVAVEPVTKIEEIERNSYTLNDYRIFSSMLKDIKEHNQNSSISIDKNLEYRLITKYSDKNYEIFKKMLKNYSN